ncbi:hypothetical protein O181_041950 [Austropuccinia psidii MF-1]|uniref:Uncharacterized protein n=1 Tax=Austropuccinia psidii MF-1 TaxID=1389203 RepID=A0A9Q3DJP3_9BASI|nr:hypothetical protein [Austropuccinia psidii MF-1]
MLPQTHQGVISSWHIFEKFLKEEEIAKYSNGWNPLSSKPQIKKIKDLPNKKEEGQQGKSPSSFYWQATSRPTSSIREEEQEKELEETILPKLQYTKNPNRCHGKCLQHGQKPYGIQGQRGTKNQKAPFPKEITLIPNVVNTLTQIRNSILPLKDIKNSLLSLKEINISLLSLTEIVGQNKKEIDSIKFLV